MTSITNHVTEWGQSLVLATSIALITVIMFVLGGFDLATERGRLILFLWTVAVGMIGTYLALFKFRKGFRDGPSGGFL